MIFSKEELDEFSKDYIELAIEALDSGDTAKARKYLVRQNEIKNFLHDSYLNWIVRLMTLIYEQWGEDAAVAAVRKTVEPFATVGAMKHEIVKEGGLRAWIEQSIDIWRVHASYPGLTVTEDDEKVTINLAPCGSGGQLINAGLFEGDTPQYARLKKPGPHTWGETEVPVYCSHCSLVHEIMPMEGYGQGAQLWVHGGPFPKRPGDPCVHHYYKDPSKIPAKYYERFNKAKEPSTG
jgi:hypothetical protein